MTEGNGKIGNRSSIRAMSDLKHMDAGVTRDSQRTTADGRNTNTCYALGCSRARIERNIFMASKSRPASSAAAGRPLSVKATRAEVDVWKSVFVLIFCCPTLLTCVPQPSALQAAPCLSNEGNERAWRAIDTQFIRSKKRPLTDIRFEAGLRDSESKLRAHATCSHPIILLLTEHN